jgi:hypothetical protein
MFGRSKTERVRERASRATALARELAQDEKFRKRLLSAIQHGSKARRRTRRRGDIAGAVKRFARDQALQAELRSARDDLQRAYARLESKQRTHRLRRITLLAGAASLAAVPRVRERATALIGKSSTGDQPSRLEDLTRDELYARAQEAEIPGRSDMTKE